jgi:orotidine-5'-phosphate decarboxylase
MSLFRDKFKKVAEKNKSLLCIGLDPDPEKMPLNDIILFNNLIIEATQDIICSYKPNLGFYEQFGSDGLKILEATLKSIPKEIPVIGDAKMGDIGSTSKAYAHAMFDIWGFDAITFNPYLGKDSLDPFLAYKDKELFILCRTSNPGAKYFQDLLVINAANEKRPLYQYIALKAEEWNEEDNIGLVVGASSTHELKKVRPICPTMLFLIPGVGTQGGDLQGAVKSGVDNQGRGIIINVARDILYASKDKKRFVEASRARAIEFRDEINDSLVSLGKPW